MGIRKNRSVGWPVQLRQRTDRLGSRARGRCAGAGEYHQRWQDLELAQALNHVLTISTDP